MSDSHGTAPRPATEPMRYTGDGTPDMAVDYIPGDDPASLDNQDTRETVNTTPPPLRDGEESA